MENVIKKFNLTGECLVDIDEVVKTWDDDWSISQWKETYRLCVNHDVEGMKIQISKLQAHTLIGMLDLVDERSDIFRNGRTWRRKSVN